MLFKRDQNNPIIIPEKDYENKGTFNPCAIIHQKKVYLIYRAENQSGISILALAISKDGYNFEKYKDNPIIEPTLPEEKAGCEDPRVTKIGDIFYLTYTAYDGRYPKKFQNIYTALATSKDLVHWKKQGIILRGIKAAAIFSKKINGKYVMFIGGEKVYIAKSKDMVHWKLDNKPILDIRKNFFDNRFVETGPPPFEFKGKLVLFFNTADKQGIFNPSLALLDKNNPRRIIYRADKPIMTPTEEYELKGTVPNVIFGTGLVELNNTYFYYYGAADKYICVATVQKKDMERYLSSILEKLIR